MSAEKPPLPSCSSQLQCSSLPTSLSAQDLLTVQKPAQYLGSEVNSVIKQDCDIAIRFALCFPDTYEVGMSHLGMQILYSVLNGIPDVWAERAYMPMPDMEELLRQKQLSLCTLESKRALRDCDVLGFSLQYELCATNILAMLDLAGLHRWQHERTDDEPLIIGGGPYCYHPEAIADFFDAFFLGDAEQGVLDIVEILRQTKAESPRPSRANILERLSRVEGIYVPSRFQTMHSADGAFAETRPLGDQAPVIVRRLLSTMEGAPYPKAPIVPNIKTVHNRLSIEVMRGCVRGCRFCQAGYLYRPQRERSPQEILEMIETTLPKTGYEELSLLSLSTADYCSIVPLLRTLMDRYGDGDKLAISFPSTRVDALTPEVLEQVQRVRRTGFTIAPEGGTQRLRDVINKGVTDEQILETCGNVFRMGWNGIKLYFMLGLPTETDEDLQGIVNIASRIKLLPEAKGKDITVSVSTLVPKPHTPFQWAAQIGIAETLRRQRFLAAGLKRVRVNFRCHDPFSSFLEGVFCRAGRELAPAIERAYELGSRLDAWQDRLSEDIWFRAFTETGVDPAQYLQERNLEAPLPWDHLSCGISKDYFAKEFSRAMRARETPDCLTTSCSICGACDYDAKRNILWPRDETTVQLPSRGLLAQPEARPLPGTTSQLRPEFRYRLCYTKLGNLSLLGHLEFSQMLQRAAKRAALPLAFTAGYHPLPKFSFGPPLQLGIESEAEYVDVTFTETMEPERIRRYFNDVLVPEVRIMEVRSLSTVKGNSIQESLSSETFFVELFGLPNSPLDGVSQNTESEVVAQLCARSIERSAVRGKKAQTFQLSDFISNVRLSWNGSEIAGLFFTLRRSSGSAGPKPREIADCLSGLNLGAYRLVKTSANFLNAFQSNVHQNSQQSTTEHLATSPAEVFGDEALS